LLIKDAPILKAYKTNHDFCQKKPTQTFKTKVYQNLTRKILKPISATRQNQPETSLIKENLLSKKAELENLQIENQTQILI